ncbi:MAG: hypothetical protein ABI863_20055 [Ginsengibacter sp.]
MRIGFPMKKGFWYEIFLNDSVTEYVYVNALTGAKRKAFNKQKITNALQAEINQYLNADRLHLKNLSFN